MAKLVSVKRRKDEPFQKLWKRFKRKVNDSEHLQELRERQHFVKPSVKKRKQKQQAVRELKRLTKENKDIWG